MGAIMEHCRTWLVCFLILVGPWGDVEADSGEVQGANVPGAMEVTMADTRIAPQEAGKELELKFRLTRAEDLDLVISAMSAVHVTTARQVNMFFDSDALDLDKEKYTVRLRMENGAFELGAKSPEIKGPEGIRSEKEEQEHKPLSPEHAEAILQGRADPLDVLVKVRPQAAALANRIRSVLGAKKLRKVGSFVNFRETVKAKLSDIGEQKLEMDTSIFPGNVVHYEIELEIPGHRANLAAEIEKMMKEVLARTGISYKTNPPSKAKRFFKLVRGEPLE